MHKKNPNPEKEDIRSLTSLRALAAFFVLLLHYNQAFPGFNFIELFPFISQGHVGVDVFFFLSGYILTYVYAHKLRSFCWNATRQFLILRIARIYPAHIISLIAIVALYVLASVVFKYNFNDPDNWRPSHLIYHVTMTHAWGAPDIALWNTPSWSISAEWLAYLLFPLTLPIIVKWGRTGSIFGCAALLLSIVGVYGIAQYDLATSYRGWLVVFRVLSEFWTGAMLFILFGQIRQHPLFDALAIGIIILFFSAAAIGLPDYSLALAAPVLILSLHKSSNIVGKIFSMRYFVFLGAISYSVYIIHFPIQLVLMNIYSRLNIGSMGLAANAAWYVIALVSAIFFGWVLYAVVENPSRRAIKRRWGENKGPLTGKDQMAAKALQ